MPGSGKFSFSIFNDYPGALSSSASSAPVLQLAQKDLIYVYQIGGQRPWLLGNDCFSIGSIVDSKHQSNKAYEQLVKMTILSAEGEVSTYPMESRDFAKNIMSKLAFLPQIKIKMIVDFLFWWVEETQRLKKLLAEQEDLKEAIRGLEASGQEIPQDLSVILLQTESKLAARPSQRDPKVEEPSFQSPTNSNTATDEQTHDLPSYNDIR